MCSPGRWPIDRRILPDDYTSKRLRKIIVAGLVTALRKLREEDEKLDEEKLKAALAKHKVKLPELEKEVNLGLRIDLDGAAETSARASRDTSPNV